MSTRGLQRDMEGVVLCAIERLGRIFRTRGRAVTPHGHLERSGAGSPAGDLEAAAPRVAAPSTERTQLSDDTYLTTNNEATKRSEDKLPPEVAGRREPVVTEHMCEFVKASDGERLCDALLLNQGALNTLQERRKHYRVRYRLDRKIKTFRFDHGLFGSTPGSSTEQLEDTKGARISASSRDSAGALEEQKTPASEDRSQERARLARWTKRLKQIDVKIQDCDDRLYDHLDGALEREGYQSPELSESGSTSDKPKSPGRHSGYRVPTSFSRVSSRTRECRKADIELDAATDELGDAEDRMRSRQNLYYEQRQAWRQARDNDETSVTSSRFDQWYCFQMVPGLTQDVRNAEEKLKEAKQRARELGMMKTDSDFGFETFSHTSYGYSASIEENMISHAPVAKIEAWKAGVETGNAREYAEVLDAMGPDVKNDVELTARDVDDWAARIQSIRCGSSIGVLDDGPNREWIDLWQERCGRSGR